MINKDWLKNIQQGMGKEIAREFFLTFSTQERVSMKLYPNRKKNKGRSKIHYVEPIVNLRCKEWNKIGFFNRSKPIPFNDKWGRPQKVYWKIMNFNPIYAYCEEKGIIFNEKEKIFLEMMFIDIHLRKEILEASPDKDIITATLNFYAKNCILNYFFLLRDIRENPSKYKKEISKAEEINHPKSEEQKKVNRMVKKIQKELYLRYMHIDKDIKIEFDAIKILVNSSPITPSSLLFRTYVNELGDNRTMILSIDDKILRALNIIPPTLIAQKNTPQRLVKKVYTPAPGFEPGLQPFCFRPRQLES